MYGRRQFTDLKNRMEHARMDTLRKEVEGFLESCMADNAVRSST